MQNIDEFLVDGDKATYEAARSSIEVQAADSIGKATDGSHELTLWPLFLQLEFFFFWVHTYNIIKICAYKSVFLYVFKVFRVG